MSLSPKNEEEDNTLKQIDDLQNTYYSTKGKNVLFKNKQKMECASVVCENIPIEQLISKTVYILSDTNKLFFDYTIFKLFAHPTNFHYIVETVILFFNECIAKYSTFEFHINIESLTVSALERYKELIKYFCAKCAAANMRYSSKIENIYIHNCPKTFDNILTVLKPFIDPEIMAKICR
jgi:hypothetical protein